MLFGGNFPPRGWKFCNGETMRIMQYTALYSLLGTTYGGNGTTTFAGNVSIPIKGSTLAAVTDVNSDAVNAYTATTPAIPLRTASITTTVQPDPGGGQPVSVMQPYLALNYIICVEGDYPNRN